MSESKFGTFEDLINSSGKEVQSIALRLKEIIIDIDPDTCETVRLGEKAATFGLGPKKMSEGYAYIMPNKNYVNLGFFRGVLLTDKSNLLEGTGKNMRHIKVYSMDDSNNPELKELIRLAVEERNNALKN